MVRELRISLSLVKKILDKTEINLRKVKKELSEINSFVEIENRYTVQAS